MTRPDPLGDRSRAVFETWLDGRGDALHPDDRAEAAAFWGWLGERERPAARVEPVGRSRWPAAAAAALLAVAGSVGWMLHADPQVHVSERYRTAHAERRVVRLVDGSVVTLAADTQVDVAFTAGERRLRLVAGEALFAVAHNAARPFIVETTHGEVKAVGTAFDVSLGKGEADVTVVEGVVRIALPGGGPGGEAGEPIVKLARKGESVAFGVAARGAGSVGFISQSAPADIESATAWTRGQLVFHGEPLSQVIATINRYATDRVVLADPKAADLPVYGVVDQGDTAAIRDLVAHPDAVAIRAGEGAGR